MALANMSSLPATRTLGPAQHCLHVGGAVRGSRPGCHHQPSSAHSNVPSSTQAAQPWRQCSVRVRCSHAAAAASLGIGTWRQWFQPAWWDVGSAAPPAVDGPPRPVSYTVRRIAGLVACEKTLLVAAACFMVAAVLCELAIPQYTSRTIFAVANGVPKEAFNANLLRLAAAAVGYATFAAVRGALFSVLNNRLSRALRTQLFGTLIREPASFHDSHEAGQLTSRLTSDCYAISRCISTSVNVAVRNGIGAIGGGIMLCILSWQLAAVVTAIFALLWVITIKYGNYMRSTQRVAQDVLAASTVSAEESFLSARVVRTFGTEQLEQDRYRTWLQRLYDIGMRQSLAWGLYVVTGVTAQNACKVTALLLGGAMTYQGLITPEQLTTFMFYTEFVTSSSLAVCDQYGSIMEALGASERVIAHLDDPPAPQIAAGHVPQHGTFSGRLELRNVSFKYANRPDKPALSNVSMVLKPGKLMALVGPSGSGKSTLIGLLERLYDPTEGCVLADGIDLRSLDAAWYRSQIGVVSQEPKLFSLTVAANISYGCPFTPSQAEIEAAARAANAHDFICALPQGYATPVTDKLLSGGQRQRICLARALVRQPRLLMLDEATSALDAESEHQVQQALDRAMRTRDRSVLVIAHRLSTVRHADRIFVLDKGQIVEQGSHKELLAMGPGGVYWSLVSRQTGGLMDSDLAASSTSARLNSAVPISLESLHKQQHQQQQQRQHQQHEQQQSQLRQHLQHQQHEHQQQQLRQQLQQTMQNDALQLPPSDNAPAVDASMSDAGEVKVTSDVPN